MRRACEWLAIVWLLLASARRRANARLRAAARRGAGMPGLLFVLALIVSVVIQVALAWSLLNLATQAADIDQERGGHFVVAANTLASMSARDEALAEFRERERQFAQRAAETSAEETETLEIDRDDAEVALDAATTRLHSWFKYEARSRAGRGTGSEEQWRERLDARYASAGAAGFAPTHRGGRIPQDGPAFGVLSFFLAVWWISLVLQGEGMAFDTTRRRHPMWEWYLSFPAPQSAVFVAEALVPAVSNPTLLLSPLVPAVMIGVQQHSWIAGLCGFLIGIPFTVSAAIGAKALEVLILLRSAVRHRASWLALLSVVGFAAFFTPFLLLQSPDLAQWVLGAIVPWAPRLPSARILLDAGSPLGWLSAFGTSVAIGIMLALPAFVLLRIAVARGLEGSFGDADTQGSTSAFRLHRPGRLGWLTDPLLRKEWLWLKRDRGALLQLLGLPLLLVGFQYLNMRNLLTGSDVTWNKLAGLVVGLGSYMLFISGPRALLSEGPAMALTLSWPRSLEDTLRMKVRLIFALVSAMVWLSLGVIGWLYPHDLPALFLVALAWPIFGLSVAEKAVTLIRKPSQAGQSEPLSQGELWAAGLGNLSFAIGLFTARWQLAIAALAMNWVFAAAVWQRFRVRLDFLFDPDSQPILRPPTILSAVVAIVGLMELGAVLSIPFVVILGADSAMFAYVTGYGLAALVVSISAWHWNRRHGVSLADIFRTQESARLFPSLYALGAIAAGALFGMLGVAYQQLLAQSPWPPLSAPMRESLQFFAEHPDARLAYALMAVGIAPWVEEYIFRGLLFRAMRTQWGVWACVGASSAFFAVLHPFTAWPMVFALGALSALLFERSRALLPCVLLHFAYNGVIVGFGT